MITFEQLAKNITEDQGIILNGIWWHFLEKDQWPATRLMHRDFEKAHVQNTLNPLGGYVVHENIDMGKSRYMLTLLGVLLTFEGKTIEQLIVHYLEFMLRKFNEDPEREIITSEQIYIALASRVSHFDVKQLALLKKVVQLGGFLGYAGSNVTTWTARFPSDIDEWTAKTDFRRYLRTKVMDNYDPSYPIDERGRALYQSEGNDSEKEREQKFKILLSPGQAVTDFGKWKAQLSLKEHRSMAVVFIDIDRFKILNDRYTESKIDITILLQVQNLLASLVSLRGEAYKVGGDEFVMILPNHNVAEAMVFSEKVRHAFAQHQFHVDEAQERLTISGGIAVWPEHGDDYETVKLEANKAKLQAKSSGRNRISIAGVPP